MSLKQSGRCGGGGDALRNEFCIIISIVFVWSITYAMENGMKMLYTRLKISLTSPLKHKPALVFHGMGTLVSGYQDVMALRSSYPQPGFYVYCSITEFR